MVINSYKFIILTNIILQEIEEAVQRHPNYPTDPVRRAGILCEEAGECMAEALDLTRVGHSRDMDLRNDREIRTAMFQEAKQAAATAIRLMYEMSEEAKSVEQRNEQ